MSSYSDALQAQFDRAQDEYDRQLPPEDEDEEEEEDDDVL